MYADAPIHAKVYIMRKNMEKVPDTYGSVITGSSNFSEAGLQNNLEFNVELKDSRDVEFALEKFELWGKICTNYRAIYRYSRKENMVKKRYYTIRNLSKNSLRGYPHFETLSITFFRTQPLLIY